ncbi:hypothetical protein LIER_18586 [Lithospermum erythrorhizon]|uniref:Uncharacterized protein n=1 Tax=Lithospermum erythrorhizon TaxID=34254 RepID=A0AAV3QH38_LITER
MRSQGTTLSYELTVVPKFKIPAIILEKVQNPRNVHSTKKHTKVEHQMAMFANTQHGLPYHFNCCSCRFHCLQSSSSILVFINKLTTKQP